MSESGWNRILWVFILKYQGIFLALIFTSNATSSPSSDCIESNQITSSVAEQEYLAYRFIKKAINKDAFFCNESTALDTVDLISSELSMFSKRLSFCANNTGYKTIAVNLSFFRKINKTYGTEITEAIAQLIQKSLGLICEHKLNSPGCVDRVGFNTFALQVKNKPELRISNTSNQEITYKEKIEKDIHDWIKKYFDNLLKSLVKGGSSQTVLKNLSNGKLKVIGSKFVLNKGNSGIQIGLGNSYTEAYIMARINRFNPGHKSKTLSKMVLWVEKQIQYLIKKLSDEEIQFLFTLAGDGKILGFKPEAVVSIRDVENSKQATVALKKTFPNANFSTNIGYFFDIFELSNALIAPHYEASSTEKSKFSNLEKKAARSFTTLKKIRQHLKRKTDQIQGSNILDLRLSPKLAREIDNLLLGLPDKSLSLLSRIRQTGEIWSSYKSYTESLRNSEPAKKRSIIAVVMSLDIREAANMSLPARNFSLRNALKFESDHVRIKMIQESFLDNTEGLMFRIGGFFFRAQLQVVKQMKSVFQRKIVKVGNGHISLGHFSIAPYVTGDDVTAVFFISLDDQNFDFIENLLSSIERRAIEEFNKDKSLPKIRSAASFAEIPSDVDLTTLMSAITRLALKNQLLINSYVKPQELKAKKDSAVFRAFGVGEWRLNIEDLSIDTLKTKIVPIAFEK